MKCVNVLKFLLIGVLLTPSVVNSQVIFEENFDSQTDFSPVPSGAYNDMSPAGAQVTCDYGNSCTDVPTGWTGYKSGGFWFPPTYKNTFYIDNTNYRGASGKGFTFWNESNNGGSGDGWGNDGMLTKVFDADYQEMYVRFWLKTKTGFKEHLTEDLLVKVFRVMHFDRTGSFYSYFSGGTSCPIAIWDFKHSKSWGIRETVSLRGDPQETNYYDPMPSDIKWSSGEITDAGEFADGSWHRYDFYVKMNTYSGGAWNKDGVYSFTFDGTLVRSLTNVQWKYPGSTEAIGFNTIAIGGNNNNHFDNNHGEQWYAIDDIIVSNTPIDDINVPTTSIQNTPLIKSIKWK